MNVASTCGFVYEKRPYCLSPQHGLCNGKDLQVTICREGYRWPRILSTIVLFVGSQTIIIQVQFSRIQNGTIYIGTHYHLFLVKLLTCLLTRETQEEAAAICPQDLALKIQKRVSESFIFLHYNCALSSVPKAYFPMHLQPIPFHSFPWYPSEVSEHCRVSVYMCCTSSEVQRQIHVLKCGPEDGPHYACPLHQQGPRLELAQGPLSPNRWKYTREERVREKERREERE